jgi:mRNA interferase MazF
LEKDELSKSFVIREKLVGVTGNPFEVRIAGASPSAVLADQVKSLDWRKRGARRKGMISAAELADVRAKIRALIG